MFQKMEKNLNTYTNSKNLLSSAEFLSILKFEADYATVVKGGHQPYYYSTEKKTRLVNDINILSAPEQKEIVYNLFTSKN